MSFKPSSIEALNLLLQFDRANQGSGIKVHSNARPEVIAACELLFAKGLIDQADGGFLTDAGLEALLHVQVLASLLNEHAVA
ncbi:TIGR02647 family protein [Reinekea sp.]|jgi:uncharacterized protein (TIGR02647 family)|uniref:TIGR02647 family protein n=1 Tax=SAR86 cluster bacterium TaxID=2030880 RepID=A0A973A766_9GAMM|nr:TIGR02647 family protein [Reinekea sp.]MDP4912306.1 TIGR02647 family protein [Pseudomonadales bacterium]NQV63780.1 TIGR02647 family protein [SAR86 cluster bacterium]|tara:strand:- start:180 stop:425 length:246 start_codon:yes stop_codon:yes gene_type:complete